ncbi:response regulator transcription factor [Pseudomonas asplenii]|uniref:response regulator transcription factor n=1 Tax=Pseudomonas asplenii TaxID=53407 RepID=UPI000362C85D|nr:response regulator transcription factor [Pseudomonas fuscovaginae]
MRTALIVDDHPFVRLAIKILLEKLDYEVLAEADNGVDAVQRARELEPQLIVMDLNIPRLDGLEVITRISALGLPSRIVVLTEQSPAFYSERCMRAGALGYVSKTAELDELQLAVRAVMLNKSFFPRLEDHGRMATHVNETEARQIENLSNRELSILRYIARGMKNKEISELMLLSDKTVSTYKTRLIDKLNLKSVVALAEFAKRNQLL